MSSTRNSSFLDTSDQLMDLSLKNFWIIINYPYSDPGSEFEIVSKKDLLFDSWEVLEKGAMVTVKYGNAKLQGTVVTVSDDYDYLTENFETIVQEYSNESKEINLRKEKKYQHNTIERKDFIHIIKVADKDTQTDPMGNEIETEHNELKKRYEDLENKYNNLKNAVSEIKVGMQAFQSKLDNINEDPTPDRDNQINHTVEADQQSEEESYKENSCKMVQIGSRGTKIPQMVFNSIKWASYSAATRKLLITLFPRPILATHSLTGKPSPAFITSNKQVKMKLNPNIIADIIEIITRKCLVSESLVRSAITTKCADENKMYKKRLQNNTKEASANDKNEMKRFKLM